MTNEFKKLESVVKTAKDITTEAVQSVQSKTSKHPLFFYFVVFWCIINWEVVLLLFSELPVLEKIAEIKKIYSGFSFFHINIDDMFLVWLIRDLIPLLMAIFVIFIWNPFVANLCYIRSLKTTKEQNAIEVEVMRVNRSVESVNTVHKISEKMFYFLVSILMIVCTVGVICLIIDVKQYDEKRNKMIKTYREERLKEAFNNIEIELNKKFATTKKIPKSF